MEIEKISLISGPAPYSGIRQFPGSQPCRPSPAFASDLRPSPLGPILNPSLNLNLDLDFDLNLTFFFR